jgi:hypothetical protein
MNLRRSLIVGVGAVVVGALSIGIAHASADDQGPAPSPSALTVSDTPSGIPPTRCGVETNVQCVWSYVVPTPDGETGSN